MTARRRRLLGAAAALTLLAGVLLFLRVKPLLDAVAATTVPESGWSGVRIARAAPDDTLRLEGSGPRLAVDVYRPAGELRGGVLLVHGNRAAGVRTGFYRLLARSLADRGVGVWALDLRGFGRSDPAPEGRPLTAADLLADVSRGADLLDAELPAGLPRGLIGHSLGAILALRFPPRPGWRVLSLEPGPDLRERVVEPPAPDLPLFVRKLEKTVRGGIKDTETVRSLYDDLDPERGGPGVPRGSLLILQGWNVSVAHRRSMRDAAAAHPGAVVRFLDSADHEFGVVTAGSRLVHPENLTRRLANICVGFMISGAIPAEFAGEK